MESEFKNPEEVEEFEEREGSFLLKLGKIFLSLILILVLLYFSGIREYFFFKKTPTDATLSEMDQVIDLKTKIVPMNLIFVREPTLGTEREADNAISMVENSSKILLQAGINLEIENINEIKLDKKEVSDLLEGDVFSFEKSDNSVTIILVKTLGELNGLAYPNRNLIIMPDYLAGRDYRTLAHEVGHVFGLGHKEDSRKLMSQGSTGVLLSKDEVIKIREKLDENF